MMMNMNSEFYKKIFLKLRKDKSLSASRFDYQKIVYVEMRFLIYL